MPLACSVAYVRAKLQASVYALSAVVVVDAIVDGRVMLADVCQLGT